MDRTTLKRIHMLYSIVLLVLSGFAIFVGVITFFASFVIWIIPESTAYTIVGGGCILLLVGFLGFLATTLKNGENTVLLSHMVGLVIVIIIQVYMSWSLIASHGTEVNDPVGIVLYLFGYRLLITSFGRYFGLLIMLLTIPQIIALYVTARIYTTKPNLLETVIFHK